MQSYGQQIAQRKEEVENYNKALQALESRGGIDRRDMYHDLERNVAERYGVSQEAAHQMIEIGDNRANKVWDEMVEREVHQELAQVKSGYSDIENKSVGDSTAFVNEYSGKVTNEGQIDLQKQAASEGLDAELMKSRINQTQDKVANQQKDMTENANNQIHSVEHHNKSIEQGMNKKIDKYEKDRIGQGAIGNTLGVGGMNAAKKAQEYLKGGDNAPQVPSIKPLKNGKKK